MAFTKQRFGIGEMILLINVLFFPCCNSNQSHITDSTLDSIVSEIDAAGRITESRSGGFVLEEFSIDNHLLCNILDTIVTNHAQYRDNTVLALELMKYDTLQSVDISSHDKAMFSKQYINYYNRRVIGYTVRSNDTIVVLSNIDYLPSVGDYFSSYLHPIGKKSQLDYVYFPSSLYRNQKSRANETSKGTTTDNWADAPYMYEPPVLSYHIINGEITSPPHSFRR